MLLHYGSTRFELESRALRTEVGGLVTVVRFWGNTEKRDPRCCLAPPPPTGNHIIGWKEVVRVSEREGGRLKVEQSVVAFAAVLCTCKRVGHACTR